MSISFGWADPDISLRLIISELYKSLPKAVKEQKDIDNLIKNPDNFTRPGSKTRQKEAPDIEWLKYEMVNNSHSRDTVSEDVMEVILEFTKTPDLREMAVASCSELIETIKGKPARKKERWDEYETEHKLNDLTKMGFLYYTRLYVYPKAISYFKANYSEPNREVALYALLKMLWRLNQKNYFLQEYEKKPSKMELPPGKS